MDPIRGFNFFLVVLAPGDTPVAVFVLKFVTVGTDETERDKRDKISSGVLR